MVLSTLIAAHDDEPFSSLDFHLFGFIFDLLCKLFSGCLFPTNVAGITLAAAPRT
jgi:hypothetical protein